MRELRNAVLNRYLGESGASNFTRLNDPEFERILEEINTTIDPQKRDSLIAEMDQYIQTGVMAKHLIYWRMRANLLWDYVRRVSEAIPPQTNVHTWLTEDVPTR